MKKPIPVGIIAGVFAISTMAAIAVLTLQNRLLIERAARNIADYRNTTVHLIRQDETGYQAEYRAPDETNSDPVVTTEPEYSESEPTIIYTDPEDALPWGVAQKVDDTTYTIRVGYDDSMASPGEVYDALNAYRRTNGRNDLAWDDRLASYAQSRADYFHSIGSTDKHAGFDSFLENEDGFAKLGFMRLGENSYYGGKLTGTHLIEWVFSQSPGHNANQLDPQWTHVGIGTSEDSANLIFGYGQI